MPTYVRTCKACSHHFEATVPMSTTVPTASWRSCAAEGVSRTTVVLDEVVPAVATTPLLVPQRWRL